MKLGIFGGGFKPFTTGHFSKLADAIRDNDKVYLFYGMQQKEPVRYGKRGKPRKSQQKFRSIGNTERTYDESVAQSVFEIYKGALERIPNVEVFLIQSQAKNDQGELAAVRAPVTAIFKTLEGFVDNPENIEKITIYGDADSMRPYMRSSKFIDHVRKGLIQFGGAIPGSHEDYIDPEKLARLMDQGNKEAADALRSYYPDLEHSEEDTEEDTQRKNTELSRLQSIRGTEVRDMASSRETSEEAKRYLPPFLSNSEKDQIVQILIGDSSEETASKVQSEAYLRAFIRGIIRG